jgi:hypothetical protein
MRKISAAVAASALLVSLLVPAAFAQGQPAKPRADARFFPLEEVRPGMKGVGHTVFKGSETEEFGVEILGVLEGFPAPRQSAIIAKLTGENVVKTKVFGGMSGSPVYIDGKLVGAVAFTYGFAQEPIAGITPKTFVLTTFSPVSLAMMADWRGAGTRARASASRTYSFAQLASTEWRPDWPKPLVAGAPVYAPAAAGSPMHALLGQQLLPISTPVVFTGISQEAMALFAPQLQSSGLIPVAGAGGGAAITPMGKVTEKTLLPGASVTAQLVRGDFSLAAAGTVTWRDGDKVYAFGHPFLGLGVADMPMAESSVVTVVSSFNNSFKLSKPGQLVGTVSQDRSTGIYGLLGQAPKMIPVTVNVQTSRDRSEKYTYEIANDQFLTPLLLNITVYSTLTSTERSLGESTISVRGRIDVRGQQPIHLERRFSSMNAGIQAAGSVATPVAALLTSGFDGVEIGRITIDITSEDLRKAGTLDRIVLDRAEVGRGEKVEVQAYVRTDSGKQFVQRIPVTIPTDVPLGQLVLFVGDGGALQQASAAQNFVPADLAQLVSAINKIKKNDRLYVKLFRLTPGAVVGTAELPSLPPSVVATLNSERNSGGFTPTALSPVDEQELPAAEFVIEGQQLIAINVVR